MLFGEDKMEDKAAIATAEAKQSVSLKKRKHHVENQEQTGKKSKISDEVKLRLQWERRLYRKFVEALSTRFHEDKSSLCAACREEISNAMIMTLLEMY